MAVTTTEGGTGDDRSAGGFFAGAPRLPAAERAELLGCLDELDGRLAPGGLSDPLGWRGRAAAVLAPETACLSGGRGRWLDLVGDLLDASGEVLRRGLAVEALAMEGVAGRLLDVLLGEAPQEPPGAGRALASGGETPGDRPDGGCAGGEEQVGHGEGRGAGHGRA